jgi:hypothetical protein
VRWAIVWFVAQLSCFCTGARLPPGQPSPRPTPSRQPCLQAPPDEAEDEGLRALADLDAKLAEGEREKAGAGAS